MRVGALVMALVLLSAAGCGTVGADPDHDTLHKQQSVWQQRGVTLYRFEYGSGGMADDVTRTVVVKEGNAVSVDPPWGTEGPNSVRTMEDVFRQVERVLDQPGEGGRSATYDPSLGYPTSAGYSINKINGNGVVDDFWGFWVKNFTILDK